MTSEELETTVLLIEDQTALRILLCRMLESSGFTVLAFEDPELALQAAATHAAPIHLLITDMALPTMSGTAAAARLEASRPGIPTVFISGLPQDIRSGSGAEGGPRFFLAKPFTAQGLLQAVSDALSAAAAARAGKGPESARG